MIKTTKAAKNAATNYMTNNITNLHFPASMKQLDSWLLWVLKDNKKVPLNLSGYPTDPTKGFSYSEVTAIYNPTVHSGLGFIAGGGVVAVDLDHCITEGQLSEFAKQLVDELQTYTEISVSGTGLHLFYVDNSAPEVGRKSKQLELYTANHYIALTGNRLSGTPAELAVLNGKTAELLEKYFPARQNNKQYKGGKPMDNENVLKIAEIIDSPKLKQLFYDGDISSYNSQSEADSALLTLLALLTGSNKEQMRELFSQSALGQRDKWFREDYQELQLNNVIQYVSKHEDNSLCAAIQVAKFIIHPDKLSPDIYKAAARCKNSIQYLHVWDLFLSTCKLHKTALNVTVTQINQNIKLVESAIKQDHTEDIKQETLQLPEPYNNIEYKIPEGYVVNSSGIYMMTKDGYKLICTSAIYITQIITNSTTKEQKSQIYTYKHGYSWTVIDMVDNTYITNASKLALLYGKHNTSINSTASPQLIKYLDKFIAENYNNIKQLKSTANMGWFNDTFVTPYNSNKYIVDVSLNQFASNLVLNGDFDTWKHYATIAFTQSTITRFIVSACFANVLLKPLNHRSFNLYIWGNSKIGKSTLFQLAASIWGTSAVIETFGGTLNGYIIKAVEHNDFPLLIDDKQQMRENMNTNRLLMTLSNGQSDPKMTKDSTNQPVQYWRTINLFNGEEPLIEDNATNGVHTRTISLYIENAIFNTDLSNNIWTYIINKNTGWAGKTFVDSLENVSWENITQEYNELYDELKYKFPDKHEEHISYVTLIAITETLVCKNVFNIDSDYKNMATNILSAISDKKAISNSEKFWEHLISWIAENKSHFKQSDASLYTECYGEYRTGYLAISKSALATEFKRWGGFSVTKVIDDLYQSGKLLTYLDNRDTICKTWNTTINGIKNIKCIRIPIELL